jgi:hypothetical protein
MARMITIVVVVLLVSGCSVREPFASEWTGVVEKIDVFDGHYGNQKEEAFVLRIDTGPTGLDLHRQSSEMPRAVRRPSFYSFKWGAIRPEIFEMVNGGERPILYAYQRVGEPVSPLDTFDGAKMAGRRVRVKGWTEFRPGPTRYPLGDWVNFVERHPAWPRNERFSTSDPLKYPLHYGMRRDHVLYVKSLKVID